MPSKSPDGGGGEVSSTAGSGPLSGNGSGAEGGSDVDSPAELNLFGEYQLTLDDCAALDAACIGRAGCDVVRSVFVLPDGDLIKLAYASQGDINLLTLLPEGDHFTIDRTLVLTYLHEASAPPYSLSAGPFDVGFSDEDGNGDADTIRLEAAGTCDTTTTDVKEVVSVDVTLTGSGEVTEPQLSVQGDGWLSPVDLPSNEPLFIGSSVVLVATDGTRWDATPVKRGSLYVTGFTITADLPSNTDFTFEVDVRNISGGRTSAALPFKTYDPWSPLDDLGFERGVDPHLVGTSRYACDQPTDTARLAGSIGNVRAIDGESSLLVPYGQNVATLLTRPAGATKLRLSVIPLYARDRPDEPLRVQLGNRRAAAKGVETSGSGEVTETGDPIYPLAGPVESLELDLPEENGDLLLEIQAPCVPGASATAAWLDALDFE